MPDPMPIIEVHGLTKHFGNITAVDHIGFTVNKGEILGLLGPNGAGKTTTIQLLLGLTTPTSGRIMILGLDLGKQRRNILAKVNFSSADIHARWGFILSLNLGAKQIWTRLSGLLLRHLYLYRRSVSRIMEIVFWPVMSLMVWGFLSGYLKQMDLPIAVDYLLGAMILWELFYRSQQSVTLSLTEEFWLKTIAFTFRPRMCSKGCVRCSTPAKSILPG